MRAPPVGAPGGVRKKGAPDDAPGASLTAALAAEAGPVIDELRRHADRCEDARRELECFTANRQRMDCPAFREQGLCVTTGVVEGACKSVVGSRLKRGGMHWTVKGANAIIALRCAIDSNRFDGYWERQAAQS